MFALFYLHCSFHFCCLKHSLSTIFPQSPNSNIFCVLKMSLSFSSNLISPSVSLHPKPLLFHVCISLKNVYQVIVLKSSPPLRVEPVLLTFVFLMQCVESSSGSKNFVLNLKISFYSSSFSYLSTSPWTLWVHQKGPHLFLANGLKCAFLLSEGLIKL